LRVFDTLILDTETQLVEVKKIYDSVVEQEPSKSIANLHDLSQVRASLNMKIYKKKLSLSGKRSKNSFRNSVGQSY
jgi:hypothetical protein